MINDKTEKKYPLNTALLRNPEQAVDEEIKRIMDDELFMYALTCALPIVLALFEWWQRYFEIPSGPWGAIVLAIIISPISFYKLIQIRFKIKPVILARDSERAVGKYLEKLRGNGYRVLHDIEGKGIFVDHVVVSPHGIFVIETKMISIPGTGTANIVVSEDKLLINGKALDGDPLVQVKASSKELSDLLKESTGKDFPIQPVVVFPGWHVMGKRSDVWVLNPKSLLGFIENKKMSLKQEDAQLATYHLARYIRSKS